MNGTKALRAAIKPLVSPFLRRWRSMAAERRLRRVYKPFISNGDLCFDIGAHQGTWSKAWLKMGARVVAVEPQPALADGFLEPLGVVVERTAVGAVEGEADIALASEASTVATLAPHWQEGRFKDMEWDSSIIVPITTLDALIDKHGVPRVCKIDVEGYEREVLRGLTHPIPVISFEFTSEFVDHAVECLDLVARLGDYQARILVGEGDFATEWAPLASTSDALHRAARDPEAWGDVFVKLIRLGST